tara:strand:- start:1122 stop:1436 length:315 start_codon:yes stop_codon:yes gene_type:complete
MLAALRPYVYMCELPGLAAENGPLPNPTLRRTSSWLFLFGPAWPTSARQIGIGLTLTLACPCLAARYFFLLFFFLKSQTANVSSSDPIGIPSSKPAVIRNNISK